MSSKQPLTFPGMPTLAEWEDRIILNADYFTVCRRLGPGRVARNEFQNKKRAKAFKQALAFHASQLAMEPDRSKMRLLVYAVTEAGRQVCIPEQQFNHYLELMKGT